VAALAPVRLVLLAAVIAAGAAAAERPAAAGDPSSIPTAPTEFVTDRAAFLTPKFASELSRRLEDYQRGTGHQLIVYIDRTTGGVPIEDWTVRAFNAWGVGRKKEKDGVALFIFSDDRRMRIEVGYGLEDKVPDARAGRIIDNEIRPLVRNGDRDGGVKAGVDALIAAIGGAPEPGRRLPARAMFWAVFVVFGLFVLLMRWAASRATIIGPGGRLGGGWGWGGGGWGGGGGGWGGGGGGFSGGGGSFGGGGSSSSW